NIKKKDDQMCCGDSLLQWRLPAFAGYENQFVIRGGEPSLMKFCAQPTRGLVEQAPTVTDDYVLGTQGTPTLEMHLPSRSKERFHIALARGVPDVNERKRPCAVVFIRERQHSVAGIRSGKDTGCKSQVSRPLEIPRLALPKRIN